MVSVYHFHTTSHPTAGNVGRNDILDDLQHSEQPLFIVSTPNNLETDGGIIIRGGVPLSGDAFFYPVPWCVWEVIR